MKLPMQMPMKMKLAALVVTALPVAFVARVAVAAPLALGAPAPLADTKLQDPVSGKDVTLAGVKGKKGTLVVFTCNHCPFARAWEERIVALGNDYAKKGIGVVVINSSDPTGGGEAPEAVAATAKARKMTFPYAIDTTSAVARAFGATKTPEAYVFDAAGKLAYHGAVDDNHEAPAQVKKTFLKDALDAVLAGKAPSPAETKSVGCGIKFRKTS